jgi:hypothetical protein
MTWALASFFKDVVRAMVVAVSYGTVWNFIHREGMSFKKKRAAGRARSPRRGAPPRALEKISDED